VAPLGGAATARDYPGRSERSTFACERIREPARRRFTSRGDRELQKWIEENPVLAQAHITMAEPESECEPR